MIIEGHIDWDEFLKAQYLHMRPRPFFMVVGVVVLAVILLGYGYLIFNTIKTNSGYSPAFAMTFMAIYLIVLFYYFIPYKARKLYMQHQALRAPFRIEAVSEGLNVTSELGEAQLPWDVFPKWKEGDGLFLLYHTHVLFQIIPKRLFRNEADMNMFRDTLVQNVKKMS